MVSGSGRLEVDGKEYLLKEGSCVFLDCRKPYSHTTDENNLWTLRWCHFYGPTLSFIYEKYVERGGRPMFHTEQIEAFDDVVTKLMGIACKRFKKRRSASLPFVGAVYGVRFWFCVQRL